MRFWNGIVIAAEREDLNIPALRRAEYVPRFRTDLRVCLQALRPGRGRSPPLLKTRTAPLSQALVGKPIAQEGYGVVALIAAMPVGPPPFVTTKSSVFVPVTRPEVMENVNSEFHITVLA